MKWLPSVLRRRQQLGENAVEIAYLVFTDPQLDLLGRWLGVNLVGDVEEWLRQPEDDLLQQSNELVEMALLLIALERRGTARPDDRASAHLLLASAAFARLREAREYKALALAHLSSQNLYMARLRFGPREVNNQVAKTRTVIKRLTGSVE